MARIDRTQYGTICPRHGPQALEAWTPDPDIGASYTLACGCTEVYSAPTGGAPTHTPADAVFPTLERLAWIFWHRRDDLPTPIREAGFRQGFQ